MRFLAIALTFFLTVAINTAFSQLGRAGGIPFGHQPHKEFFEQRVDIQFSGGPLIDLVEVIHENFPEVNLIVSEKAESVVVRPLQLRQVGFMGVLNLMTQITEPALDASWDGPNDLIYMIDVEPESGPANPTPSFQVYVVGHLLGDDFGMRIEDILTMIESALELIQRGDRPHPKLKFHPTTGLLLVAGGGSDTQVIGELINAIEQSQEWQRASQSRRGLQQLVKERDETIKSLELQIEKLKKIRQTSKGELIQE